MGTYWAIVFVHLVGAVFLVGLALFWTIMVVALRRRFDPGETTRLLRVLNGCRWPHVVVPNALRLPLPWVGWGVIGVVAASGIGALLETGAPEGALWLVKLLLFGVILIFHAILAARPVPALIHANFACTVAILVFSGLMLR